MGPSMANIFGPLPGVLGRRQKVKYQLISKSISKILYQNLCVFTNQRYKTYQTGFSFCHLGGGTLGYPGGQKKIFFSNMVMCILNQRGWRAEQNASKYFIPGSNL